MAEGICIPTMAITTLRATSKSQAKNNLYNILSVKTLHWGPRLRNSFIFNDLHKLTQQFSCQLALGMEDAPASWKNPKKNLAPIKFFAILFYDMNGTLDKQSEISALATLTPAEVAEANDWFDGLKTGADWVDQMEEQGNEGDW